MSTATVVVSKVINAPRDEVFRAFIGPEVMRSWFFPDEDMSVEVANNPVVGGDYTLKMHTKNGDIYTHIGEYKEITPYERLVFTWNSDFVQNTVVTVTFTDSDSGDGTEVTVSHDLLPEGEMAENHRGGWTGCLNRLDQTISA